MKEDFKDGFPAVFAKSANDWRSWLQEYHKTVKSVWLIIYHKKSGIPSVYYDEAVDEALCFGWVDSKPNKRDNSSYYQFFSKRNAKSNWSKVNKEKVARLTQERRMAASGLEMIEVAKQNGTWDALNDVDNLIVPEDLNKAFSQFPESKKNWDNFPKSTQRGILEWIFNAKKTETREKRIIETASKASKNIRANQWG